MIEPDCYHCGDAFDCHPVDEADRHSDGFCHGDGETAPCTIGCRLTQEELSEGV